MSCGLAEIRMDVSLLEMAVQLMTQPLDSFRTMSATPYWCFESSPQYQILCPSSVVVSPKPAHVTSTRSRMSHLCSVRQAISCQRTTFSVIFDIKERLETGAINFMVSQVSRPRQMTVYQTKTYPVQFVSGYRTAQPKMYPVLRLALAILNPWVCYRASPFKTFWLVHTPLIFSQTNSTFMIQDFFQSPKRITEKLCLQHFQKQNRISIFGIINNNNVKHTRARKRASAHLRKPIQSTLTN